MCDGPGGEEEETDAWAQQYDLSHILDKDHIIKNVPLNNERKKWLSLFSSALMHNVHNTIKGQLLQSDWRGPVVMCRGCVCVPLTWPDACARVCGALTVSACTCRRGTENHNVSTDGWKELSGTEQCGPSDFGGPLWATSCRLFDPRKHAQGCCLRGRQGEGWKSKKKMKSW